MSPSRVKQIAESLNRHNERMTELYMLIEEAGEDEPESLAALFLEELKMNGYPNWAHPISCFNGAVKTKEEARRD